jgi:heterotetrameric sarcosine oxidase gamma subunit
MVDDLESFTLQASERAFLQDLHPWVARSATVPGCRRLAGARVVCIRHVPASSASRQALQRCALPWPDATGEICLVGDSHVSAIARRQPEELLLVEPEAAQADALLAALEPSQASDAVAIDLSHGMLVLALEGPQLDLWLSHFVDASAIPRRSGSAKRTRLVDIAVLLMRLDAETVWLVADRALAPYLSNWLTFTHEGAFAKNTA